jgi:hypothetical protein
MVLPIGVKNDSFGSYLEETNGNRLFPITGDCFTSERKLIKKYTNLGVFDNDIVGIGKLESQDFIATGVTSSNFDGSEYFDISGITPSVYNLITDGDLLLLRINNNNFPIQPIEDPLYAIPYLWYCIKKDGFSTLLELDRPLPYIDTTGDTQWYILPKGYNETGLTINFDSFDECSCEVEDNPYLSHQVIHCEPPMGISGCTDVQDYQNSEYLGLMRYLGYCGDCLGTTALDCADKLDSIVDTYVGKISLVRINNIKMDYILINPENQFSIHLPMLMWHRRNEDEHAGMVFKSTGERKSINGLYYYDIQEDEFLIGNKNPLVVGRLYHTMGLMVFHHPDLITAMSNFSNRNWTLPALSAKMIYPTDGIGTGILTKGHTMYLTYELSATTGITTTYPQQQLIKLLNDTEIDRDVSFKLESTGLLGYMRKLEPLWDGLGFYGHVFNLLWQIVPSGERPTPMEWKKTNFTTNNITDNPFESIDPIKLERQDPNSNQFTLSASRVAMEGEEPYNWVGCKCPRLSSEWLLMGNIRFTSGISVFRRLWKVFPSTTLTKTSNPTFNGGNLKISEIGILDSNLQMVAVAKIQPPIEVRPLTQIDLELDF